LLPAVDFICVDYFISLDQELIPYCYSTCFSCSWTSTV